MRTLNSDHTLAQKGNSHDVLYKIVVQGDTYTRTRIIWGDETETPDSHLLTIVLDNSDKALDSKAYKGRQCILSLGEIDANGVERYSPLPPFYVMDTNLHSSEGLLLATLTLVGEPNMFDMDKANRYLNGDNDGQDTIKDLLTVIAGNGYIPYTHTTIWIPTFDSEDGLLDTLQPKGSVNVHLNDSKLNLTNRLLLFTKVTKRFEDDGGIHFFVPTISGQTWVAGTAYVLLDYVQPTSPNNNFTYRCTTAGTSGGSEPTFPTTAGGTVNDNGVVWTAVAPDYEYALDVPGEHTFLKKVNRKPFVVPNSVQVTSISDDGDGFTGLRTDTDSSSIRLVREFIEMTLASSDQGDDIAAAKIEQYRLRNEVGSGEVPMNVGAETHDWIKFTDQRQDDVRLGNIGYLQRQFGSGVWTMRIGLGDIRNAAFPGLIPPDVIRNYRVHDIPQVDFASVTGFGTERTEGGSDFVPPSGRAPGVRPPIDPRTDPETGLFPDIIPTITSGVIAQRLKQNQDLGFATLNEHSVVIQRIINRVQELGYAQGGPSAVGFTGSGGGGVAPAGTAGPQRDLIDGFNVIEGIISRLTVINRLKIPIGADKFGGTIAKRVSYTDDATNIQQMRGSTWNGQTFTPLSSFFASTITLDVYREGSPGTVTVSIRATDGSIRPTGDDLASGTFDGNGLTTDTGGEQKTITLTTGLALVQGTKYAIVARAPTGSSGNRVLWHADTSTGAYTGGTRTVSSDSGGSWVNSGGQDMYFEVGGQEVTDANIWIEVIAIHFFGEDGVEQITLVESVFNAKGDLLTASANNTPAILTAGANGDMLVPNSATPNGLEWVSLVTHEGHIVTHEGQPLYV